ncbi:MAG: glycosyltransferase [Gammaproteobacteria bacterium]|nr:glycosyltransferase [Gammaproteobacteria bacterium]
MTQRTTETSHSNTLPLVSILCRSMNRPELVQALESVDRQTYPAIEIVLVDATGTGTLDQYAGLTLRVPVRLISTGEQLIRPRAANVALENAKGAYCLFLDEDDWIEPDHIATLVQTMADNPGAQVAYSGVQNASSDGQPLSTVVSVPFNADRLKRDNYIPIHAALFSTSLIAAGCRFDDALDIYEDWDFWLQCAQHSEFIHVDKVSAWYRLGGSSDTLVTDEKVRYQKDHPIALAREKVLEKWRTRWTGADLNQLIGAMDQSALIRTLNEELAATHQTVNARDQALETARGVLAEQKSRYQELQQVLEQLRAAHQHLQEVHEQLHMELRHLQQNHQILNQAHRELDQDLRALLNSFSWRAMGPYRKVKRSLDARVLIPVRRWLESRKQASVSKTIHRADDQSSLAPVNVVQCAIVSPATDHWACNENFTLQAWAWSAATLKEIELLVDGAHYTTIPGDYVQLRTGLQNPTLDDARQIGFAVLIDSARVGHGAHTLTLRVLDNDGHERSEQRAITLNDSTSQYLLWRRRHIVQRAAMWERAPLAIALPEPTTLPAIGVRIAYRNNLSALRHTLQSLAAQTSTHWRCEVFCAADDAQNTATITGVIAETSVPRTTILDKAHSVTAPLFDSVELDYLTFLEAGETLAPDYIARICQALTPDTDLVYTDHDAVDEQGIYRDPWFTFEWAPELLLNQNYVGGVYVLRATPLALQAMQLVDVTTPAWRYDLLLRAQCSAGRVTRVAEMLWSAPALDAQAQALLGAAEAEVVRGFLSGGNAEVLPLKNPLLRHIRWPLAAAPKVLIIIPTTGNPRYLKPCLDTLLQITDYPSFEIIILDNSRGRFADGIEYARQSGATVLDCDEDFNWSRLNNKGAAHSDGEMLLFLNDDIEVCDPHWLDEMVRLALLDDVGTVGCRLLYPNGALQHGGVFLVDHGGGARHLFHRQLPGKGIYQHLDACARETSANTGAALMITRAKFDKLGRFDERLALVGNDIDLCLRCREADLRNIWTPRSTLVHHESVSRKDKPIGKDEKSMWQRWESYFIAGDPFYNPQLSLEREDCSLKASTPGQLLGFDTNPEQISASPFGVNLIAYIRAEMGVGEASRGNAAALEASGVPFGIINYEKANPARMSNLAWKHREIKSPLFDINILHINADHTPAVIADLGPEFFMDRYNIGFWAWELPEFPDRWMESFKHLDEIWVPSTFVNNAVAAKSPIPVLTIPHAVSMDGSMVATLSRQEFGIPGQCFVFLSMFDIHSIAQRKNPYGSISAFQKAFAADDASAVLVIKINNANEASVKELQEFIGEHHNILIVQRHLNRQEINALIALCDCFVSLHHSEGFGLGPAEAMALGKVALLTNWSGNTEYMTAKNCIGIDYTLTALDRDYGPYERGQVWASPNIDDAAQSMRKIAHNTALADEIGRNARRTIEEDFSPARIGTLMRKRLEVIRDMRKNGR